MAANTSGSDRKTFKDYCDWTYSHLFANSFVTREAFDDRFVPNKSKTLEGEEIHPEELTRDGRKREALKRNLDSTWSRVTDAVLSLLEIRKIGGWDNDKKAIRLTTRESKRYETDSFRPYDFAEEKAIIGMLVARYLKFREGYHVLLGSGSTVFHVGRSMKYFEPYPQSLWTINFPLMAEWCELGTSPVDEIQVPKGALKTKTFRYASMKAPPWDAPIVVVGADGCFLDRRANKAKLYANEDSVADNTNRFIEKATDTVICCLVSQKLEKYDRLSGQKSGPIIKTKLFDEAIQKFLVTDKNMENNPLIDALRGDSWKIVTQIEDWDQCRIVSASEDNKIKLRELKPKSL
jgi:hypothetical protein